MKFSEYRRYDMVGLAELIHKKEVTPQELLSLVRTASETINPKLNAIVHSFYPAAEKKTESITADHFFGGVPFLIKDLGLDYMGQPRTHSSLFCRDNISDHFSELVERFLKAGLVIFGRSNVPEFGLMAITESKLRGPCSNPWNLAHTPGGSSGGSAAAVAAGLVPAAHADDGGGSIRIPASACGLIGLKPTRGRVPQGPRKTESWSGIVSSFAVTKSVRDAAALLDEVHGPETGAPYYAPPMSGTYKQALLKPQKNLRIAYSTNSVLGKTTNPECVQGVQDVAKKLSELGHHVEENFPAINVSEVRRAYFIIVASSIASEVNYWGQTLNRKPKIHFFEESTWFFYLLGKSLSAVDFQWALGVARQLTFTIDSFLRDYDVLLNSTMAHLPPPVGQFSLGLLEKLGVHLMTPYPLKTPMLKALDILADSSLEKTPNTQVYNLSGHPAISLPTHLAPTNLPVGVQLATSMGGEDRLLNIARQLEELYPWEERLYTKVPDLSSHSHSQR